MRVVEVVDYRPEWPRLFEEEAARLRHVFGDMIVEIHHIGSTSVPGLRAKPIIDIMPVVRDIKRVEALNPAMRALGYLPRGELGLPGRRYFSKGGEHRTHQVHVYGVDNRSEIDRHLAVRDYLRAHPQEARAYGALKASLACKHRHDIDAYMDGKDAFVKELEAKGLKWRSTQS